MDNEAAEVTNSMRIAAEILKAHPEIADDTNLLRAILNGLRKAILNEREACRAAAGKYFSPNTTNRPEFSDVEQAVLFTQKVIASNIMDDIDERGAP